jgi:hypothetical protein
MLDEETRHAGELVGLRRNDDDVEFNRGEVLTAHFETVRIVRVVKNVTRSRLGNALLKSLE